MQGVVPDRQLTPGPANLFAPSPRSLHYLDLAHGNGAVWSNAALAVEVAPELVPRTHGSCLLEPGVGGARHDCNRGHGQELPVLIDSRKVSARTAWCCQGLQCGWRRSPTAGRRSRHICCRRKETGEGWTPSRRTGRGWGTRHMQAQGKDIGPSWYTLHPAVRK